MKNMRRAIFRLFTFAINFWVTSSSSPDFEYVGGDHADDDGGGGGGRLHEHRRQHAQHHAHDRVLRCGSQPLLGTKRSQRTKKLYIGFVCFCPILLGQVGIRQNGQVTLAAMVETTKPQSTKNSL